MSLGLRYCKNHPHIPLILVNGARTVYWKCDADEGCLYTEQPQFSGKPKVIAVNGKSVRPGGRGSNGRGGRVAKYYGSYVEERAIGRVDGTDDE